jgi:hypothetical protein
LSNLTHAIVDIRLGGRYDNDMTLVRDMWSGEDSSQDVRELSAAMRTHLQAESQADLTRIRALVLSKVCQQQQEKGVSCGEE